MKMALTIGALGGLLAIAGYYSFNVWDFSGGTALGFHGWIAIVLGVVATFAVGAGLMALVFYSSRRGYDQQHDDWARGHRGGEPGDPV